MQLCKARRLLDPCFSKAPTTATYTAQEMHHDFHKRQLTKRQCLQKGSRTTSMQTHTILHTTNLQGMHLLRIATIRPFERRKLRNVVRKEVGNHNQMKHSLSFLAICFLSLSLLLPDGVLRRFAPHLISAPSFKRSCLPVCCEDRLPY